MPAATIRLLKSHMEVLSGLNANMLCFILLFSFFFTIETWSKTQNTEPSELREYKMQYSWLIWKNVQFFINRSAWQSLFALNLFYSCIQVVNIPSLWLDNAARIVEYVWKQCTCDSQFVSESWSLHNYCFVVQESNYRPWFSRVFTVLMRIFGFCLYYPPVIHRLQKWTPNWGKEKTHDFIQK